MRPVGGLLRAGSVDASLTLSVRLILTGSWTGCGMIGPMPIQVSDKQLDRLEREGAAAVIVRSERTKKGYALIPESVYAQLQPLLTYLAVDAGNGDPGSRAQISWNQGKNARRVALINKKHDKGLTAAEKKELKQLVTEADAYRDAAAPVRLQVLEFILAGLRRQPPKSSAR